MKKYVKSSISSFSFIGSSKELKLSLDYCAQPKQIKFCFVLIFNLSSFTGTPLPKAKESVLRGGQSLY